MKNDIIEFKKRWAMVNAAELRELRATPLREKARQTAALMESAKRLGWIEMLDAQEEEVRDRWNALRKAEGK
jgi:hypothetical protein